MEKKHVNLSFDMSDPIQYETYMFIQKLGRTKSPFIHILISEYLKKYSTLKSDDLSTEDAKALANFAKYIYSNDHELKLFAENLIKKNNNILANKTLLSKDASLIKLILQLGTSNATSIVSSSVVTTKETEFSPDAPISLSNAPNMSAVPDVPVPKPEQTEIKEDIAPQEDKKPHINKNVLKAINSYKHS